MSAQSDRVADQLRAGIADVKAKTAEKLRDKLRESTPVRTGYTRARWQVDENGVSNDAGDAVMRLNDGSSRRVAAGFIEQAIDETTVEMQREVDRPVKL